jgi:hypothetical protein
LIGHSQGFEVTSPSLGFRLLFTFDVDVGVAELHEQAILHISYLCHDFVGFNDSVKE